MRKIFEGVCTALVTPWKNNKVDFDGLKKLIEININEGADAICILGTTGESCCVSQNEREQIIRYCKKIISKRCKLIVGTGNNNFETAYCNTKMAKRLGADGALVVTPYYNKTTQAGLVKYYEKLSEIKLPLIVYNVPSRTGLMVEESTIKTLLKNEYIYGLKESTADINRIINLCKICKNKIAIYSGEDKLNFIFYTLGASGCISVASNFICKKVKEIYVDAKSQKIKKANNKQTKINEINDVLFCETNPIPVKYILARLGYIKNEVRLPLIPLSKSGEKRVEKVVAKILKNVSQKL